MVKKMYLKDTKREKEREREIDFGIIFNLALITFYDFVVARSRSAAALSSRPLFWFARDHRAKKMQKKCGG